MFDTKFEIAKDHQANLRKQVQGTRIERESPATRLASILRLVLPGLDVASGSVIPATH
jgi:hypothetical protein